MHVEANVETISTGLNVKAYKPGANFQAEVVNPRTLVIEEQNV